MLVPFSSVNIEKLKVGNVELRFYFFHNVKKIETQGKEMVSL